MTLPSPPALNCIFPRDTSSQPPLTLLPYLVQINSTPFLLSHNNNSASPVHIRPTSPHSLGLFTSPAHHQQRVKRAASLSTTNGPLSPKACLRRTSSSAYCWPYPYSAPAASASSPPSNLDLATTTSCLDSPLPACLSHHHQEQLQLEDEPSSPSSSPTLVRMAPPKPPPAKGRGRSATANASRGGSKSSVKMGQHHQQPVTTPSVTAPTQADWDPEKLSAEMSPPSASSSSSSQTLHAEQSTIPSSSSLGNPPITIGSYAHLHAAANSDKLNGRMFFFSLPFS